LGLGLFAVRPEAVIFFKSRKTSIEDKLFRFYSALVVQKEKKGQS